MNTQYVAEVVSQGGRSGRVESADGSLNLDMERPAEMTGEEETPGGANPEQLFAAAYAACFHSAIESAAKRLKIEPAPGSVVTALVALNENDEGGSELAVELRATLPGVNRNDAEKVMQMAHQICPYSKAVRGNVDVQLTLD